MTFGCAGSIASEPMFKLSCLFHSERHVCPASLLCHTPPPAAPTQIRSGCFGWQTMLVSLPPMFVGPMHLQRARAFGTGRSRLTRFLSLSSFCTGGSVSPQPCSSQRSVARQHDVSEMHNEAKFRPLSLLQFF